MKDELRASYDAVPYRHGAIALSHPARIGAIARLLGREAAPPHRCRVLELGCAEGMNLLPLAERFPGSEFVGIDFSPAQIAVGEKARAACGLANARLVCADLREFTPDGAFDYVIAHGVYSWVPAEVRERLLAVCAAALAPGGVAYVSYNTMPGWGVLGGVREILLSELRAAGPDARVAYAEKLLLVMERTFAGQPGAYAALMRDLIAEMRAKPIALTLHDELGIENAPCTFLDFTAHAARHRLHFLAEAHYASMPFGHLPPTARDALAELQPDFLRSQQLLDLFGNRRIRSSLLTRTPADERALDAAALRDCALATHLRLDDPRVNLAPGEPMIVTGRHGVKLDLRDSAQKAFLGALLAAAPERVPFLEVIASARALLAQAGVVAVVDEAALAQAAAQLFTTDQMDIALTGDGAWLRAQIGQPGALMRHQARERLPIVNRWHETVELPDAGRARLAGENAGADLEGFAAVGLTV